MYLSNFCKSSIIVVFIHALKDLLFFTITFWILTITFWILIPYITITFWIHRITFKFVSNR